MTETMANARARKAVRALCSWNWCILMFLADVFVLLSTSPYSRFYRYNTKLPLWRMARLAQKGRDVELLRAIHQWRLYKAAELEFAFVASGLLTAAFIGAFSWDGINEAYWLTKALWGCGLVLAFLGISLSAQQRSILNYFGPRPACPVLGHLGRPFRGYFGSASRPQDPSSDVGNAAFQNASSRQQSEATKPAGDDGLSEAEQGMIDRHRDLLLTKKPFSAILATVVDSILGKPEADAAAEQGGSGGESGLWKPKGKMLFFWQAPIMFMGYSVCAFLLGVTLYFATPLIHGEDGPSRNTAIVYLSGAGFVAVIYEACSFWASYLACPPEFADEATYDNGDGDDDDDDDSDTIITGIAASLAKYFQAEKVKEKDATNNSAW